MTIAGNPNVDDASLVAQSLAGRRDAFAQIVARYQSLVCSVAYSGTGSLNESEDVAQETFVTAWKELHTLREPAKLRSWLCRIARNRAYHSQERRKRHPLCAAEDLENESGPAPEEQSPRESIIRKEEETILWQSIENIPALYREPLVLFYREHKSVEAVARQLDLSEDTVRQRLSRGRKMLHEQILLFVEGALERTKPGKAFTVAVVAALPALAISAKAAVVAGTAAPTSASTVFTKAIAMTTLQKTIVVTVLTAAIGAGIHEAHRASTLQTQLDEANHQLAAATEQNASPQKMPETAPAANAPRIDGRPAVVLPPKAGGAWPARFLTLNTNDWRAAFALGQELAALPPNEGLALLQNSWRSVTNVSARQQLLKAFDFAGHERLPAVLDLAMRDSSPEVQNWAINYLKEVSLQDFSSNYSAGLEWLSSRRDGSLSAAFSDAVWQMVGSLRSADGDQLHNQLALLSGAGNLFSKFPSAVAGTGLDGILAQIAGGSDPQASRIALEAAHRAQFGDAWGRDVALPLLTSDAGWEVRQAAAGYLGSPGREWALQPLLDALSESVRSPGTGPHSVFGLATPLAELGSPKAIPTMIALIEADNTQDTIYDIGYFGLHKLTGVNFDQKHDGAWWRQWWNDNKQRFPPDAQALPIPRLPPIQKQTSSASQAAH